MAIIKVTKASSVKSLKKQFSSSRLTSLHKNACVNQKWPLLNLLRQLLSVHGFVMKPLRKSDGYDENGVKKYERCKSRSCKIQRQIF